MTLKLVVAQHSTTKQFNERLMLPLDKDSEQIHSNLASTVEDSLQQSNNKTHSEEQARQLDKQCQDHITHSPQVHGQQKQLHGPSQGATLFHRAVDEQLLNNSFGLEDTEDTKIFTQYLEQLEDFYRRFHWME